MSNTIAVKINNVKTGVYVARIYVGTPAQPLDVMLDTGSSMLAVDGNQYDVSKDNNAHQTGLVQTGRYVTGSWSGDVFTTNVNLRSSGGAFDVNNTVVAVATQDKGIFYHCDGILGLAYRSLDKGMNRFEAGHQVKTSESFLPYFTALKTQALAANIFSFYTLRSNPDIVNPDVNHGYFIVGGGEEYTDLYSGAFHSVLVTHDKYYNVNLKAIRVGLQSNIIIPPAQSPQKPNCIVDSGTNGLVFPTSAWQSLKNQFSAFNKLFGDIIEQALKSNSYPQQQLDLDIWPDIIVTLEGNNEDIELVIKPYTYWQTNAGKNDDGEVLAGLQFFGTDARAILGLPLLNNYFTVFDRSANHGLGVIKFASIKA